jgi:prostaglandin-endoperoxide synthase 2/linoleate 10R-lipoxygenase
LTYCSVTCGLYINIVLNDYVGTLVGIPELNTAWFLDPYVGAGTEPLNGQATPIATGNQCSVEFNLVYRFHTIISDRDDKWTQGFMKSLFPDKDPETITLEEFYGGLVAVLAKVNKDPAKRDLHGMTRDTATGQFDDGELVKILTESTEDCAGMFPP